MDMSTRTTLETFTHPRTGKPYTIQHHTAGLEAAGSGTRETKEVYSISWEFEGSRHSRRFKTLAECQSLADAWGLVNDNVRR